MHHRVEPKHYLFRYRVYMWFVDLDELEQLAEDLPSFGHNQRGLTTSTAATTSAIPPFRSRPTC